jgi:two-component sensor histidine kinase
VASVEDTGSTVRSLEQQAEIGRLSRELAEAQRQLFAANRTAALAETLRAACHLEHATANVVENLEDDRAEFEREVISRFGLLPNFFTSAPDAPEIIERLWAFAKSAYFDNPIPPVLKERIFVFLSRFCENRYCITRHCAFLVGRGNSAGDPTAVPQTVEQAIRLLRMPPPWNRESDTWLTMLETVTSADWPVPETDLEDALIASASLLFTEGGRSDRVRRAVRTAFGGRKLEHLLGLLAFIRTAHFWTVVHPELTIEEDAKALLDANAELARLLLDDPESARCEMGSRLFSELEVLRELAERRELEQAKQALELKVAYRENLLKEVNHRVKNSLQIVASLLQLEIAHLGTSDAATSMQSAAARVAAVAAVHERLYSGENLAVVALDSFLGDLCRDLGRALGNNELQFELEPATVPSNMALPLALIVNELVTNAIKHGGRQCRIGLRNDGRSLQIRITDDGKGPPTDKPHRSGMGSRILQGLVQQLGGSIETRQENGGYTVEAAIPLPASPNE